MQLKRIIIFLALLSFTLMADATRIKDISNIAGVRQNQLIGYGLVVGLEGTGDKVSQTPFTQQTFKNMLVQFGIRLPVNVNLQLNNVAAVAISTNLPPFARIGQRLDVTISSIGNATSLRGGELLMSSLQGSDGKVYAIAQGSVVVSGFGAQGSDGSKVIVNSTSSGRIPNGATVEKTVDTPFVENGKVTFELMEPDFTTALTMEKAINKELGRSIAHAIDATSVEVQVDRSRDFYKSTSSYKDEESEKLAPVMSMYVPVISKIENIQMEPGEKSAKVIVNSRTGTIVVGQNVTISPVAVSHGNLSVVISERPFVSQPNALAGGHTVQGKASDININQAQSRAFVFQPGPSLGDLVSAINAIGAAPGDIISILEAIKSAGALHAELEVI